MPHDPLPQPPRARRRSTRRTHHGDTFDDPYDWLRHRDDPEVIAHLEAENAYTAAVTRHLGVLEEAIFSDIKARTQETDLSVPEYSTHEDGSAYWYYVRTHEGRSYPTYCRTPAPSRTQRPDPAADVTGELVLLDCNAAAQDQDFFTLGTLDVSPDGRLLAYSVDLSGDERYELRVRDLATGRDLPDVVPDVAAGSTWLGNGWLFYTRLDDAWRPYQLWRHELGTPAANDALVLTEDDERFFVDVDASRDRQWLIVGMSSTLTSECRLLARSTPTADPRVVAGRREGVEYGIELAPDRMFVVHNDGAPDFCVAQASLDATSERDWRPLVAHEPGTRVLEVQAYERQLVVNVRRDGLAGVDLYDRTPAGLGERRPLAVSEPLYDIAADADSEYDTPVLIMTYQSLVTPRSVLECTLADGTLTELRRTPVLDHPEHGPYRPDAYRQQRLWATATDGTRVPLSVVHRADTPLDGSAPCLLYGYGSYEVSIPPSFSIARMSLLDRGFVYAIAHVRGGGELGRAWYEDGKLLAKRNTFTDFVAAAELLVTKRFTSADRLAARGASAGGLLVGAVTNLAPGLFRAVQAAVPFVDALTTILDPSLPLTVGEWEEWGDPLHDPEVYAYMKGYTPYENIATRDYPAILATTSLNDARVSYAEPAKWVAALRHTVTANAERPVLLKTEMVAGHGGVSGRYAAWHQEAFELAWIVDQVTGGGPQAVGGRD